MSFANVLDPVLRFVTFGGKEADHFVIAVRRHCSDLGRKAQDFAQTIHVLAWGGWIRAGHRLRRVNFGLFFQSTVLRQAERTEPRSFFTKRLAFGLVLGDCVSAL